MQFGNFRLPNFLLPHLTRNAIISNKTGIYQMTQELPIDFNIKKSGKIMTTIAHKYLLVQMQKHLFNTLYNP